MAGSDPYGKGSQDGSATKTLIHTIQINGGHNATDKKIIVQGPPSSTIGTI